IEDDAADILHIMPAIELPRQGKKDITYYREVWQQRIDPKGGALHAMRDKDLLPKNILGPWLDDDLLKDDSPMRRNMKARAENLRETERARITQMGLNPDDYLPPPPPEEPLPELDELPEFMERMEQKKEEAKQKLIEAQKEAESQKAEALKKAAEAGMDTSKLENPSLPKGPPTFRTADEIARIRASLGPNPSQGMEVALSGMNLQGANFREALESADLSRARLDDADFSAHRKLQKPHKKRRKIYWFWLFGPILLMILWKPCGSIQGLQRRELQS
ncbi:MAG: pentapeptide repeat-containing protein, partial [Peptococcaceae bacterium]|nr:pentapeptide repeat-containing protein [Peptococcaceae bacterium]